MTRTRIRTLYWAGVGASLGLFVGLLEYGAKRVPGAIDPSDYPANELKIAIVTVAGLVAGLGAVFLVERIRRSRPTPLMGRRWAIFATVLLVLLAFGSIVWAIAIHQPNDCCVDHVTT